MAANIFLLTHKCGNNFIEDIFNRGDKRKSNYIEISQGEKNFNSFLNNTDFFNVRCRNFEKDSTEKILKLLDTKHTKYFVFTRHPASFFRSAARYHIRGKEKWCKDIKLKHLAGKTLYQCLHDCKSFGEQLVVTMKHFGLENRYPNNWVENLAFLKDQGANYRQIKCEDIWQDLDALKKFHAALIHDGFSIDFEQVLDASPLRERGFNKTQHATGEFKKDIFEDYDNFARDFYNMHFKRLETNLQY